MCVCVCFNGRESERESNDSEYVMFKVFPVVWFDVVQVFVWVLDQSLMCMCVCVCVGGEKEKEVSILCICV